MYLIIRGITKLYFYDAIRGVYDIRGGVYDKKSVLLLGKK